MSDFPPFRSAPPKGQKRVEPPQHGGDFEGSDGGPLPEPTPPPVTRHFPQPITVCAKCGSREVREAVLIGDEVYVKWS